MTKLSDRQKYILNFIRSFIEQHGYSPTMREIGDAVKMRSSATIFSCMTKLRDAGRITWETNKPRSIRLVEPERGTDSDKYRVSVRVIERYKDGTFKVIEIGGKRYEYVPIEVR